MKELMASAFNANLVLQEGGGMIPSGEVVLVVSEPVYSFDATGAMARSREVEALRFAASPKALRQLADQLAAFADELDRQSDRVEHALDLLDEHTRVQMARVADQAGS